MARSTDGDGLKLPGNDLVAQLLVSFWDLFVMQPTSVNHRSLRDSMQYMAVILIIGGGIGLWFRLSPAYLLWGFNGLCKAEAARRCAFAFARNKIVIDANALVDLRSVAIGACPAAFSH
jgi:hypothetical protein